MDEFHRRLDIANEGKKRVADEVMCFNKPDTLVIDLGAGTCVIERLLLERGFKGSAYAIDRQGSAPDWMASAPGFLFVKGDIIDRFTPLMGKLRRKGKGQHVVFVLSAVLHEMTKEEREDLAALIRVASRRTEARVHLIVREAVYGPIIDCGPGIGRILADVSIPAELKGKWAEYAKIHRYEWPYDVLFANFCFAVSYGPESWERERKEGRYALSENDLRDFASDCGFRVETEWFEKDPLYASTLPFGLFEALQYTSRGFVCGRKEQR